MGQDERKWEIVFPAKRHRSRREMMFIPKNEPGVAYLFSRFHEKLGFEEIVDISTMTPDVYAKRKGKTVAIELEFRSSGALRHYRVADEDPRTGKWVKENNAWRFVLKSGEVQHEFPDPENKYKRNEERGILLLRTAKEKFETIVCWEKDKVFEEDIEVIELKNALSKLL